MTMGEIMAPGRAEGWVSGGTEGLDSSRDTDGAAGEGSATAAGEERNGEFLGYMKKCRARRWG
ncbi:Subtilase family protein [Perilla frutescens var. hirtella]|nr:Subtilase family protein [Perilla frutescens var. hirtella]